MFPPPQLPQHPPRVVVTGAGIVTGLGTGWTANAEGFRRGQTGFRPVSIFDASRHRVKTAAEVIFPEELPGTRLSKRQIQRMDRAGKLLLLAGEEAWRQCGWEPSEALPVVLGTTSGGMSAGESYYKHALAQPHDHRGQPTRMLTYNAHSQGRLLGDAFGFSGPVLHLANACATGTSAIGHAWEMLRYGRAERVLTGGYDALTEMVFSGFDSLQALSRTVCRPFDAYRDGLMLGEGAAVLALETLDVACKRGANILGEIIGYGASIDYHHLTQPHPQGDAALAAMNRACESARVGPEEIDYINAHGTGTPLNDEAEAHAINRWAGTHAGKIAVSSTKASVGHLLGAAGAVEAVVCMMALQGQWLPPELSLETPDPACQFPLVRQPQDGKVKVALSNSFGFGGVNATLILRRWQ